MRSVNVLRVLGNRVLIREVDGLPSAPGAPAVKIHLPLNTIERPTKNPYGVVVALGEGKGIPCEIKIGSLVRVDVKMGSIAVRHLGQPCRIVSTLDVQCVFERNGKPVFLDLDMAVPRAFQSVRHAD